MTKPAASLATSTPSADDHEIMLQLTQRLRDTAFVGGSIALAAWTQLFVSSASGPASTLAPESLALLFAGGLALVLLPVLFRVDGRALTYIGRESAVHAGFGLVVLSLCGILADLLPTWGAVAAVFIAVAVGIRELVELGTHLKMLFG